MSSKLTKSTTINQSPVTEVPGRSACEDCEHSVPAGSASQPTLICKHKAGAELPWQVVEPDESCPNFEQSREIVPLDIAEALAEGAKLLPLTQGKFAIVDAADFDRLNKYKWHIIKTSRAIYASRSINRKSFRKAIRMHRAITNAPKGLVVDHINHNGLDNRKSKLRLCTPKQNARNMRPRKGCSSKYKGVSYHKVKKLFQAYIRHNSKIIHLGYFKNEIDAAKAYDKAAKKFFGEFAYLNFPDQANSK